MTHHDAIALDIGRMAALANSMPRGTVYNETGLLVTQGPALYLRLDGGGHWRLDAVPMRARKWIGRRVTVEGERDGFDLLAVRRIALC